MKPLVRSLANAIFGFAARGLKRVSPSHEYSCATPEATKRILFIRLDHIGDVVMSLPALRLLRQTFPDAQIDVLVRPDCAALLNGNRDAARVLTYDTPRFPRKTKGRGRGAGLFRTLIFVHRLRRARYDVAIDFRGDDIARILARWSGAPFRLGPDRVFYEARDHPNFAFLMTCISPLPAAPRHAVEANCALLKPLLRRAAIDEVIAPPFRFAVSNEARATVADKLRVLNIEKFAVLHAFSNDEKRNWTIEGFAQVADYLVEKHDLAIVLTGAQRDFDLNNRIRARMRFGERARNASGVFPLEELPAVFERAALLVSVDTGPMHIAAFSRRRPTEISSDQRPFKRLPIVALFLPFLSPRHHPCGQADGVVLPPHEYLGEASLQDIAVENVLAAIEKKLK